ncbi:MAG: hypothetical protein KGJ86_13990, partial [Chloroflexota bacterium]|nr:hypothetical protein [Chloroflexota bacterium]
QSASIHVVMFQDQSALKEYRAAAFAELTDQDMEIIGDSGIGEGLILMRSKSKRLLRIPFAMQVTNELREIYGGHSPADLADIRRTAPTSPFTPPRLAALRHVAIPPAAQTRPAA